MDKVFGHSVKTDVGLVRKANEDAAGYAPSEEISNNGDLFVVCDGMGGHVGGAIASNTAVQSIIDHFKSGMHTNPYVAINDAILFANEQIFARAQAEPELKGMGTTCTVLLIRGSETFIGHVGDSRIYLQSKGKLHRITKDHSFVQTLVDQGLISDSEAESHPRKNELIKALGIRENVEPEVCSKAIQAVKGDCFLMCSDGLSGLVDDKSMQGVIASSSSLDDKAEKLISMAKSGGGHDNITVALIEINLSPFTTSVFVDYTPKADVSITGDINPLAATQEIGGISSNNNSPIPIYKNLKFLIVAGLCVVLIVIVLFFNPFGSNGTDVTNNDVDSTVVIDGNMPNDSNLERCDSFLCVISPDGPKTLLGALNEIKNNSRDLYNSNCLRFSGAKVVKKKGVDVEKMSEAESGALQIGDKFWLDCDCLENKQNENNMNNNQSLPNSSSRSNPNQTVQPNADVNIKEDSTQSNTTDTTKNKSGTIN